MKCDEVKPSCYACTSTGRTCDGYEPTLEAPSDPSSAAVGALSQSLSVGFLGTEKELQSFYFFRLKTAPQLSGFLGGEFWERLLLQAALQEPSIRHSVLALGSMHANLEQDHGLIVQRNANGWTDTFALKNYSHAINILMEPPVEKGRQAIDLCLICSLLFACFEVSISRIQHIATTHCQQTMQNNYGSAITHVQSGMKILSEINYDEEYHQHQHDILRVSKIPYASIEMLQEMFVRLDNQATQVGLLKFAGYAF